DLLKEPHGAGTETIPFVPVDPFVHGSVELRVLALGDLHLLVFILQLQQKTVAGASEAVAPHQPVLGIGHRDGGYRDYAGSVAAEEYIVSLTQILHPEGAETEREAHLLRYHSQQAQGYAWYGAFARRRAYELPSPHKDYVLTAAL